MIQSWASARRRSWSSRLQTSRAFPRYRSICQSRAASSGREPSVTGTAPGLPRRTRRSGARSPSPVSPTTYDVVLLAVLPVVVGHPVVADDDVGHQRGAVAATLAIAVAADRGRAHRAEHAGLFLRLGRRRAVRGDALGEIALGNDPALRLAAGDEQDRHRRVQRLAGSTIGKGGNLADKDGPGKRPARLGCWLACGKQNDRFATDPSRSNGRSAPS